MGGSYSSIRSSNPEELRRDYFSSRGRNLRVLARSSGGLMFANVGSSFGSVYHVRCLGVGKISKCRGLQ
jgi:hypothetical protein